MPILGILASSRPAVAADTGAMFPLQVVTVGPAGASSVSFTNIPTTGYAHLQVRGICRSSRNDYDSISLRMNSDSGSNYSYHHLVGSGASVSASAGTSQTRANIAESAGANAAANIFSAFVIDILDYASTSKYKTIRVLSGDDYNGSGYLRFASGLWMNTSAVDTLYFDTQSGISTIQQYSQFALYGVKGAA